MEPNEPNERTDERTTQKKKEPSPRNTHTTNQSTFRSPLLVTCYCTRRTLDHRPPRPPPSFIPSGYTPTHARNKEQHQTRTSALVAVLLLLVPLHVLRQPVDPLALVDPLAVHVHGLGQVYGWMDRHTWVWEGSYGLVYIISLLIHYGLNSRQASQQRRRQALPTAAHLQLTAQMNWAPQTRHTSSPVPCSLFLWVCRMVFVVLWVGGD